MLLPFAKPGAASQNWQGRQLEHCANPRHFAIPGEALPELVDGEETLQPTSITDTSMNINDRIARDVQVRSKTALLKGGVNFEHESTAIRTYAAKLRPGHCR